MSCFSFLPWASCSPQRAGRPARSVVLVNPPDEFAALAGRYELGHGHINGEIFWAKSDHSHFLYQIPEGSWTVEDSSVTEQTKFSQEGPLVANCQDKWPHDCPEGSWQAHTGDGGFLAAKAVIMEPGDPPESLELEGSGAGDGVYRITAATVHGEPVWKQRGSDTFLYATFEGKWSVGKIMGSHRALLTSKRKAVWPQENSWSRWSWFWRCWCMSSATFRVLKAEDCLELSQPSATWTDFVLRWLRLEPILVRLLDQAA